MKKTRENQGITLIALVITIIVLLILAGVAIAMLSGENGILKKAAEAKTKTEKSQNEEDATIGSMDITTHFLTTNSKYKCSYGYITGIEVGTTVEKLQGALPTGYSVKAIDGTDTFTVKNDNGEPTVTTGLQIVNGEGKEVARTVIFGDVDCSGDITANDNSTAVTCLSKQSEVEGYKKVAGNIYNDGEFNFLDVKYISWCLSKGIQIDQNMKVLPTNKMKRNYKKMQEFIEKLTSKEGQYTVEYDEETDTYKIKGVTQGTTFGTLKQGLPEEYTYSITRKRNNLTDTDELESTDNLKIAIEYKFDDPNIDDEDSYPTTMTVGIEMNN